MLPVKRQQNLLRKLDPPAPLNSHSFVRLSGRLPWDEFDVDFGKHYRSVGRPAKPARLMAGLHYLKHMHDPSDEETVERWVEKRLSCSSNAS